MILKINGVDREVERVRIVSASEPWSEHLLEDSHVIRVRTIVTAGHTTAHLRRALDALRRSAENSIGD